MPTGTCVAENKPEVAKSVTGGVVGYSSHHLTPADDLQISIPPDELFDRAVADGREVLDLLTRAVGRLASLLRSRGVLEPPQILWRVMSTGEVFFDRGDAAQAKRDASGTS
jgi:hypothetical protein